MIHNSVAYAKSLIILNISSFVKSSFLVLSLSFPDFSNSLLATEAEGHKADFPEACLLPLIPSWLIWAIAKAPWSFIIFALSFSDGISFSLNALV